MNTTDLHIHSKYSNDGEFEIKEIVNKCLLNGVSTLSITDHNTIKALSETSILCEQKGITFIPGIEIDCQYKGTDLHLLGYNINWQNNDFAQLEIEYTAKVMDLFPEMVSNLKNAGISVDANEVLKKSEGKLPCGELIAEVLVTNKKYHSNKLLTPYLPGGKRSDMPYINFYHDYFAQGKPAYVKINYMNYTEAIELVRNTGGIPVIAHPGVNFTGKEDVVQELLNSGALGIEVFNNYHKNKQVEYYAGLALQNKVLITCGSDFHGKNKPLIDIGQFRINTKYTDYLTESISQIKND